ncbi:DUF6086 family protein [Streptomyces violascens]|uniref:DUF6086 family protein n=1 Tax=Streptomyces violascens TaxID=67381 RepID=UPI00364B5147
MQADACQIDPVVFKEFVDALLVWHRNTSHPVLAALSEGFVAAVLVLAERGGHPGELAAGRRRQGWQPHRCSGAGGPGCR